MTFPARRDPPPMTTTGLAGAGKAKDAKKARPKKTAKRKAAGRFKALNFFVDFTARSLTRAEALTWIVLFRDTKPDGLASVGQADIARRIGADVKTVKRAMAGLRKRGLLIVVAKGGLNQGTSVYRVVPLTPPPR